MSEEHNGDDHEERIRALERLHIDLEKRFAAAFPGGDHIGHCRYHDLMIEDIATRKRLHEAIMQKTMAGLVWAVVIVIGVSIWQWIKSLLR
jgi:hypothetical protein